MATGKTNARHIRVYMDSVGGTVRNISQAVSDISGVGKEHEETDVTGYSDGAINFTLGHPKSEIDIKGPLDNTALAASPSASGPHGVFTSIVGNEAATYTLLAEFGIKAVPGSGDPTFSGEYVCSAYKINGDGTYTARLVPSGSVAPDFGTKA